MRHSRILSAQFFQVTRSSYPGASPRFLFLFGAVFNHKCALRVFCQVRSIICSFRADEWYYLCFYHQRPEKSWNRDCVLCSGAVFLAEIFSLASLIDPDGRDFFFRLTFSEIVFYTFFVADSERKLSSVLSSMPISLSSLFSVGSIFKIINDLACSLKFRQAFAIYFEVAWISFPSSSVSCFLLTLTPSTGRLFRLWKSLTQQTSLNSPIFGLRVQFIFQLFQTFVWNDASTT